MKAQTHRRSAQRRVEHLARMLSIEIGVDAELIAMSLAAAGTTSGKMSSVANSFLDAHELRERTNDNTAPACT